MSNAATAPRTHYAPRITRNADGRFFTLIVRVDPDGEESVIHGYAGRHFATLAAAERSTAKHIAKHGLRTAVAS